MRRAAKVDDNQAEIVNALWRVGATVQSLAAVGNGVPDLLVGFRGRLLLLEVKDGSKAPSRRRLTPAQEVWHLAWRDVPLHVVQTPEEAIHAVTQ